MNPTTPRMRAMKQNLANRYAVSRAQVVMLLGITTLARDTEANNNIAGAMMTGIIGICVALAAIVYMLVPTVVDAQAVTGLSAGQKSMIAFMVFIAIGALAVGGWKAMSGGGHRRGA